MTHRFASAIGGDTGVLIAAMAAAWFSVLLAAGAVPLSSPRRGTAISSLSSFRGWRFCTR